MRELEITSEPHVGQEVISYVRDALARFNVAATRDTFYSPLALGRNCLTRCRRS